MHTSIDVLILLGGAVMDEGVSRQPNPVNEEKIGDYFVIVVAY